MKCCFCGKECGEYGNNPYPLSEDENDRCCDDCNMSVITARILSPERVAEMTGLPLDEAKEKIPEIYKSLREQIKKRDEPRNACEGIE